MGITALFILINMAKFVSEGKKEIGIFRALGATKGDIRMIFILQSVTYILISLLIGGIVGAIAIFATSSYMVTAAQGFINTAIGSTVTLSGTINATNFMRFDMQTIPLYAALPIEGSANASIIRLLAEYLDVPQSNIKILRGFKSKVKQVVVY
jgi:ABC-type antimicrobial peptide transport system permease subunit